MQALVLHAVWNEERISIWAESSTLPLSAPKTRGRKPKKAKPRAHPFALPRDELREVIRSLSEQTALKSETRILLLPSTQKGPLLSPWLIREEGYSTEKATELLGWNIETLSFETPNLAFEFLLGLPEQPPRGIAFGSSLRFWIEVAKFTLELITRQQFAPAIRSEEQGFRAAWEVFITEKDLERVHTLAKAMPPSGRAIQDKEQRLSPADMVLNCINRTTDDFIRKSLASTSLLPTRRGRRPKVAPLPEQWLHALSTDNPALAAPSEAFNSFATEIQTWLAQLQPTASDAPFRTCFRLDPPSDSDDEEHGEDWKVRFMLQAKDDRSLLVPAENVWKTRSNTLTFLKRRFENPQEQLLADLGKASHVFHDIETSLQTARPVGLELNAEQAYSFLRQSAPLLEQSGFGVLLPSWWEKPNARIGVKLKLKPEVSDASGKVASSGLFGVKGIIAYDWEVAVGDETLSELEFEQLADLKVPLVQVRGQWVELRPDDVEAAIEFFKKRHGSGKMTLGEAMQLGLGADTVDLETEVGLPVVEVETEGWLEDMLSSLSKGVKITCVKTPRTFKGQLRPYQLKGVSWLAYLNRFGLGACLADDMGLGKTIELIALLLHERSGKRKKKQAPTLLICPMSVVGNWQKEVERFAPSLKVMVHHGTDRSTGKIFAREAKKHDLVISTYALTNRDAETFAEVQWQHVVLDEAQNIKNPAAKQTQAIKKLNAEHRIALTGTPVENRLSELWSIMDFLNPGYLRSAEQFRKNFALPIERYRTKERADVLRRIIQPFVLRRVKTDPKIINDLPEKMEMKVYYNLTKEQASLYEAVVTEMLGKIEASEGIERKGQVLATLLKLKQICNHPALFLQDGSALESRSGKLARLEAMLEEVLAEGDKALIFTQFAGMGIMLRHYLQDKLGCETLFLYGGTPKKQRDAMIQRFQEDHLGPPLFILSLKAGGLGLNLTAANHVFHFDRWWNPAVENQATDRVFRIGQTKNVQVHKFVCIGTLEERIDQMIEQKKELAESIIGSGEAWVTEMSTEQLREVFTLSREAVEPSE
ncbi:Superfamily II DNA or RNA helicase, SNF2 family [Methanophagales archaeon]|nr:Superfamily II DNA or RNA helicase, SNF2 family [Methanophagales archaeon]